MSEPEIRSWSAQVKSGPLGSFEAEVVINDEVFSVDWCHDYTTAAKRVEVMLFDALNGAWLEEQLEGAV